MLSPLQGGSWRGDGGTEAESTSTIPHPHPDPPLEGEGDSVWLNIAASQVMIYCYVKTK